MRLKWLSLVHQQGYKKKMFNLLISMKMAVSINAIHTTYLQPGDLGEDRCFR